MAGTHAGPDPRHPIGVVSHRTGIPQDVLRAWERRYQAVTPHRTETGRRLYSDDDVHRFRLLKQLVDGGRRISDVAGLRKEELESLVREDRGDVPPRGSTPRIEADDVVKAALDAIRGMDGDGLSRILTEASLSMTPGQLRASVIGPLLRDVGECWRNGEVRVANEHLATSVIRSFLGTVRPAATSGPRAPGVIVTTLADEHHEMGALLAAYAAAEVGWAPVYLGPNLPTEEIAAAARSQGARAIALSMIFSPSAGTSGAALERLPDPRRPGARHPRGGKRALGTRSGSTRHRRSCRRRLRRVPEAAGGDRGPPRDGGVSRRAPVPA